MKLPTFIDSIVHKTHPRREVFLSLYIDVHSAAVSFWTLGARGLPTILANEYVAGVKDSWEDRGEAIDRMIGVLEEKTGFTNVTKVILGLPSSYLSPTGEIRQEIRSQIKNLARALEFTPVGFVPLHQAIIYKLKHDEGVPPSVILLGINHKTIAVSVYKIGSLAGLRDIEKHDDIALSVEQGLKSFTDLEVLPARMLLYGSDASLLDGYKTELLRHQWTAKVNFLHFPKIEVISNAVIIDSISLAGASELGQSMGFDAQQPEEKKEEPEENAAEVPTVTEEINKTEESDDEHVHVSVAAAAGQEEKEQTAVDEKKVTGEVEDAQEILKEDFAVEEEQTPEDANVVMVDAQSLGFKKDVDVLEEEEQLKKSEDEDETDVRQQESEERGFAMPKFRFGNFFTRFGGIGLPGPGGGSSRVFIGILVILLILITGVSYWFLPHATIMILEIPKSIEVSQSVIIDPTANIIDAERKVIPGKKRETSVSGEKTVQVSGKKDVGDPARGTVTIYNKSTSSLTLKKGSALLTGSMQFTLDNDVSVASASESIGSLTFGKANVPVTAVVIGTPGNLAGGTEFTLKNTSSSVAIARNDNAFAGGNSKVVTVVTRADYDAFVESVSQDLVAKANEQLSQQVGSSEKLIDTTITTKVTEKVFDQEIDQPATELHGKLTLTVSGITISDADVRAILTTLVSDQVPQGYSLNDSKTTVNVSDILVKKTGTMTANAHMSSLAYPLIDTASIRQSLAGKNLKDAEVYLRRITGIAGVEVSFRWSPTRSSLPLNKNNITVSLSQ